MKQTIKNLLLKLGEAAQEERLKLSVDMAIYQSLLKVLPRLFPAPDNFFTRTAVAFDYDAAFIYVTGPNENPEALRISLGLSFGMRDWEIEIDKNSTEAALRSVKSFGNHLVLVRIVGVDPSLFEYKITRDTGLLLLGPVVCRKFVPLDLNREDVSPEVFLDRLKQSSYTSFIHARQAFICALAAQAVPDKTPVPDEMSPALGLNYDLDLVYIVDSNGRLRERIDRTLGYAGWAASVDKKTGAFSLHTILPLVCDRHVLKLRINILEAKREKERLFLVADEADRLVYRATRPTDPDHKELIRSWTA